MNEASQRAVATAIASAWRAAEAAGHLYDAVCDTPVVQEARQRRRLLGLGKYLAGDPAVADADRFTITLMLGLFDIKWSDSLDDRRDLLQYYAQEGLARPAPQPCKPLASSDDIAVCLALDAAALIRGNMELAFSAISLSIASEMAEQGDADGGAVIATRLILDTHAPVGIALGATRIALRAFLNQHGFEPILSGATSAQVVADYDDMLAAAFSDTLRIVTANRTDIEFPDPALGSAASYLAKEIANIAHSTAKRQPDLAIEPTALLCENANHVADLAAEAYEAALQTVLR